MNNLLLLFFVLAATSCHNKPQPATPVSKQDSIIPAMDTVTGGYTDQVRREDSLEKVRLCDSLTSIKPVAVFVDDKQGNRFDKMVARIIDTNGVVTKKAVFTDTIIDTYSKEGAVVSERCIIKTKGYVVTFYYRNVMSDDRQLKIYINGRELKPGRDIDTIGSIFCFDRISIAAEGCAVLRFGDKEYLLLVGEMWGCNGLACGLSYYMLYDPAIKKAMLLQQFRSDFYYGYDAVAQTPVFIDMATNTDNPLCNNFLFAGKAYRFNRRGKIEPLLTKTGKQCFFDGYNNLKDSVFVTKALFPPNNRAIGQ